MKALDFNNELKWGHTGKNAQELQSTFASSVGDLHYDDNGKLEYSIF